MIKVIIFGCNGKMGQVLTSVIKNKSDYQVVAGVDRSSISFINEYPVYNTLNKVKANADVIIDFSHPANIDQILAYATSKKTPLVIATTGFSEKDIEKIKQAATLIPIFKEANFSYGVSVINYLLPKIKELLTMYDIDIIESHHRYKVDAPSGTALLWANTINDNNDYQYIYERVHNHQVRLKAEIGILAVRAGTVPGTHTITFSGEDELIEIKHIAYSKNIFAIGALAAANFIVKKEAGLYGMLDLLTIKE